MYRARSCGVVATSAAVPRVLTALDTVARSYTPIYAPDPATDHLGALRSADECRTLWAPHIPVPSLTRAIELWLRFGNDPVVHTAASPASAERAEGDAAPSSTSPFAYVEDYMGSNMVTGAPEHVKESAELWSEYFEKKYVRRMRQSRRTSKQYVGVLGADGRGRGAGESGGGSPSSSLASVLLDEADHPNTKWEADTFFCEVAYLSERHLKTRVTNHLQLEKLLWGGTAKPDAFVQFFEAFQQQTITRIPLPVPSIWVYESTEAKKKWAERYLPACSAAHEFFQEKLRPHAADAPAQAKLLADIAAAYHQVHAILLERRARQVQAGVYPSTWTGRGAAATATEEAWAANEVEKEQRRIDEGIYDPEDLLDTTAEWAAEHAKIQAILEQPLTSTGSNGETSYGFSLQDFWLHTERREALETVHVLESESLARVAAAARRRLYSETPLPDVFAGLEESVAKARLDLRAAVLKPHFNGVWCRMHYVKFGAASLVQHTHTASRQLLFHYAASTQVVAATAEMYYSTKPLSSQLDYASPYTFRRSLARHCSHYGVEMAHAAQQPLLLSAAHLAKAEGVIGRVVRQAAAPFGARRRARYSAAQLNNQRLLNPVKSVQVTAPAPELLAAGADLLTILREEKTPKTKAAGEALKVWPLGSRQTVSYDWTSPALDKLRLLRLTDGPLTAEQAVQRDQLRQAGRLEISLWRRCTAEERQKVRARMQKEAIDVQALVSETPALQEVSAYASHLYRKLTREQEQEQSHSDAASTPQAWDEASGEWVFAVMLDDNVPLSETQSTEVFLPYVDAAGRRLPNGEYRVVVRAVDRELNPTEHPTLMSDAASSPFSVVDALPQLYAQYTQHQHPADKATGAPTEAPLEGDMAGKDLMPFCAFLREAGLHISLSAEFAMGQSLDKQGNVSVAEVAAALRGTEYHRSQCEHGITDAQRTIEPQCRLHWSLYHPGATEQEWAAARRRVLRRAMAEERDWWLPDPMLEVTDVRTDSAGAASFSFGAYPAVARYGTELCTVLPAHGSNHMEYAVLPPPPGVKATARGTGAQVHAECTVDGTGALASLHYGAPISAADVTVEDALKAAMEAIQVAQMRHNTLSMVKLCAFEKQAQTMLFCGIQGFEFGGKHGRTYAYALDRAKREMAATAEAGQVASLQAADAERLRLSDQEQTSAAVDRFASQTNPEQRLTRFVPRSTMSGYSMEDVGPERTSTWGL
ncbi:hypothetical protein conserved [Leishmania donovani]|uniref:Hypothetical_protein_conserved n=1 Tax=Leishmania donovani TaxID=5661 RepID=A0A6J8FAB5_LEIDO|nr:hypothetical protein conserved [Leishmania donovani]VDZ44679.1 hypothetical_protein_conserved [Leishmania donovani]